MSSTPNDSDSPHTANIPTAIVDHKLTQQILIAMAAAVICGCGYYQVIHMFQELPAVLIWLQTYFVDGLLKLLGDYFVRALKLVVVPLVLFSLITGVTQKPEGSKGLVKTAGMTFVLYLGTTMLAITLALMVSAAINPGAGVSLTTTSEFIPPEKQPLVDVFLAFMPTNIVAAFAEANMLAVIVVSLMFGAAMNASGQAGKRLASICHDANDVVIRLVILIMSFAPIGVFALVFQVFAEQGIYFMAQLGRYFITVVFVLLLHCTLVYSSILFFIARVSPIIFWQKMRQVMLFAFSTASSAATIGVNLRNAETRLGVRNDVAAFTIPLGATINMDGTAIMQGVATVFIAGAYGYDLTSGQFLEVILMATMASVGTAAVPSAGLVTLSMVLLQVNLPAEAIGLIIGVDRLLDMMRTSVNVAGDAAITMAVASKENALDREVFAARELAPKDRAA